MKWLINKFKYRCKTRIRIDERMTHDQRGYVPEYLDGVKWKPIEYETRFDNPRLVDAKKAIDIFLKDEYGEKIIKYP